MRKQCTKCKQRKNFSAFSLRNRVKKTYQSWCKICIRAYDKKLYRKDPQYRFQKNKDREVELRKWLANLKSGLHCSVCPENHPACLHFHHLDPEEKDDTIGNALRLGWSKKRILNEIAKCNVLCANCHAKFHYNER